MKYWDSAWVDRLVLVSQLRMVSANAVVAHVAMALISRMITKCLHLGAEVTKSEVLSSESDPEEDVY